MADDPTIRWQLATRFGIQIDASANAWHSGHVTDVVPLVDTQDAVVVATETGGVWVIVGTSNPLEVSNAWDTPDVKSLTLGNHGPRHMFAGCARRYNPDPTLLATAPVIMETDLSAPAPLLNWLPVSAPLPATAGRVTRIAVLPAANTIVVACAKELPTDTGGIFWSTIPAPRRDPADPPRAPYVWQPAKIDDVPSPAGFWDVAVAARHNQISRDNIETLEDVLLVAGGYRGGGLYVGQWEGPELVFRRPTIEFSDGGDATAIYFQNVGTTSVSTCEQVPTVAYGATAWTDGRLCVALRSKDGGRHWSFCKGTMADASGPLDLLALRAGAQGAGWNNCIAAHPGNPGMAALGWQRGTFLTLDGGGQWRHVDGGSHTHPDVHALLFTKEAPDSIGFLFMGSDGGLARVNLDDWLGLTGVPAFRSDYNRSLPVLQCYSYLIRQFYGCMGVSSRRFGRVATGLQDNGNVYCNLAPLEPWRQADEGDGGWNAFLDEDNAYVRNAMGEVVTFNDATGAVLSEVIPITLPPQAELTGLKGPVAELVTGPRFRNAAGHLMLAVGASGPTIYGLFGEEGDEETPPRYRWERLAVLPAGQKASALASFGRKLVVVGTGDGKIYSLDAATGVVIEQPVKLPKPGPSTIMEGGRVTRITGFSDSEMFAVLVNSGETSLAGPAPSSPFLPTAPVVQTYVLGFDGGGWAPTPSFGLPNAPIFGMVAVAAPETPVEHGLLVAQDAAVYISRDNAQSWQKASKGLPRRPHCADLRFASPGSEGGTIFLSTYGRSIWTAEL